MLGRIESRAALTRRPLRRLGPVIIHQPSPGHAASLVKAFYVDVYSFTQKVLHLVESIARRDASHPPPSRLHARCIQWLFQR